MSGARRDEVRHLSTFVEEVRGRLGRRAIRDAFVRWASIPLVGIAVSAGLRPFLWPLHDEAPPVAIFRTSVLAVVAVVVGFGAIAVVSWRRRPTTLVAARRADEALRTSELVASAFAFERDQRPDEMAGVVISRAERVLDEGAVERVLRLQRPRLRSRREKWTLALASVAAVLGLASGAIDRLVVERALHPMSSRESAAAAELKRAAAASTASTTAADPNREKAIEAAQRAAAAAERGDRKRALEALEEMRKASSKADAEQREQARALRAVRDELDGKPNGASRAPGERSSGTAAEAVSKMMKDLESPTAKDPEKLKKLLDRLEKAEKAARERGKSAGEDGKDRKGAKPSAGKEGGAGASSWSRAAAALKEAREAAERGDAEGAKRAMERAEKEIAALEKEREAAKAEGERLAKLGERGAALDRSLRSGMNGEGAPEESADGSEQASKDGSGKSKGPKGDKGPSDPSGAPGPGDGDSEHEGTSEQRRVKVEGNLQARTDVKEGERAVSAIEGMGQGGDPGAYREIFPSYDTVVEEGLREDLVPAARRPTVRRYFSLIRPAGEPTNTPEKR